MIWGYICSSGCNISVAGILFFFVDNRYVVLNYFRVTWLIMFVFSVAVVGRYPDSLFLICPFHHLILKLLVCLVHLLMVFSILLVASF